METGKCIRSLTLFAMLFGLGVSVSIGQTRKPAANPAPKPPVKKVAPATKPAPATVRTIAEIPDAEWSKIVDAFNSENWDQASLLARAALGKMKAENDKKQMAQLRYFYLYALAGKAASGKMLYAELERAANGFVGKEFLMPSREFLVACTSKVNYICPVADNEKAVRVTATNKAGSMIHSFEYIKFNEKIAFSEIEGKEAFLGGTLQRAEINLYKQNLRILRLVFDKGFANLVAAR